MLCPSGGADWWQHPGQSERHKPSTLHSLQALLPVLTNKQGRNIFPANMIGGCLQLGGVWREYCAVWRWNPKFVVVKWIAAGRRGNNIAVYTENWRHLTTAAPVNTMENLGRFQVWTSSVQADLGRERSSCWPRQESPCSYSLQNRSEMKILSVKVWCTTHATKMY